MLYERKIFPFSVTLLSLIGGIVAFILVFNTMLPGKILTMIGCGSEGCSTFAGTPYARAIGISFASIQLFFFLCIFLSYFLFSESGSSYKSAYRMILPFMSFPAFIHSALYFSAMLRIKFCPFTTALFVTNLLLCALSIYTVVRTSSSIIALLARYSDAQKHLFISDDRRFSVGTFVYFIAILFLFVATFSLYIDSRVSLKTAQPARKTLTTRFLETPVENIVLSESSIIAGDSEAPLTIEVFTDPMCGACEAFHRNQDKIIKSYGGRVRIRYYYHPLDSSCNESMSSEMHNGACAITEILYAAAQNKYHEQTINTYYSRKQTVRDLLHTNASIDKIIDAIVDDADMARKIKQTVKSGSAQDEMMRHLSDGIKIDIQATPTLFIERRRIEGAPSFDSLSKLLDTLLTNE